MSDESHAAADAASRRNAASQIRGMRAFPLRSALAAGVLASVVVLAGSFAVTLAAVLTSTDALRAHIKSAFNTGELLRVDRSNFDARRGAHQYNDCLILTMAILRSEDPILDTISPLMYQKARAGPVRVGLCEMLYREIAEAPVEAEITRYHRYLHGHRMLIGVWGLASSLESIRSTLKLAGYGLLFLIGLIGAWRVRTGDPFGLAVLVLAAVFASCYGLEYFGQSLSHGPADIVAFGFLLYAAARVPTRVRHLETYVAASMFGSLTALFEFLTGGLPLGLAMIVGLIGLSALSDPRPADAISRAVGAVMAYGVAFGSAFAIKLTAAWLTFGTAVYRTFATGLSMRVGHQDGSGAPLGLVDLLNALRWNLDQIGYGSHALGYGMVLLGVTAYFGCTVIVGGRWRRGASRGSAVLLLVISAAVVPIWYAVFLNHSIEHAWFMVRLLAWPIGLGVAALCMTVALRLAPRPALTA